MKEKMKNFISTTKGKLTTMGTTMAVCMSTFTVAHAADVPPTDPFAGMTGTLTQYVTYGLAALGTVAAAGISIFGLKWAFKQGKKFFSSVTS